MGRPGTTEFTQAEEEWRIPTWAHSWPNYSRRKSETSFLKVTLMHSGVSGVIFNILNTE